MLFRGLADRVAAVREAIAGAQARGGHGQSVEIVAVTKTFGAAAVTAAWEAGIRHVGENKVQEALAKMEQVSVPIVWHLIGHLQRNKVKHLDRFALLHAMDSQRLADAISAHGAATGRRYAVLLQVNASGEASKGGYGLDAVAAEARRLRTLEGLEVKGAMTMAPFDADDAVLRATFRGCREALARLQDAGHPATELSMGMSGDYELAVEEGATMVRLGTILFGARD
ncbi:MAG TPA: YggS family pyridoxal phosphate-dependent enzyme [Gemmatimonadaceae bacterium]|nr:YggS family pyridoxal phosphate-dependent enzyme [Gemmatimonadaceae bacterium]